MKVAINVNKVIIKVEYYDSFAIDCIENGENKTLCFGGHFTKNKIYFTHALQTIETYSFQKGIKLRTYKGSEFYEKSKLNFIEFIKSVDLMKIKQLINFID